MNIDAKVISAKNFLTQQEILVCKDRCFVFSASLTPICYLLFFCT
jgi:hypothetical protein